VVKNLGDKRRGKKGSLIEHCLNNNLFDTSGVKL
jgi:hypothetical protein